MRIENAEVAPLMFTSRVLRSGQLVSRRSCLCPSPNPSGGLRGKTAGAADTTERSISVSDNQTAHFAF